MPTVEKIEKVVGDVEIVKKSSKHESPGQMSKHYAPRTSLKIIDENTKIGSEKNAGLLAFKTPSKSMPFKKIEILSPNGDLDEAASNLFSALHRLDDAKLDVIYAEQLPEIGLGRAIMDRLRKARTV